MVFRRRGEVGKERVREGGSRPTWRPRHRGLCVLSEYGPAVGAVIDGVEEKALVLGIGGEVGLGEKSPSGGQPSSEIGLGSFFISFFLEDAGEAEKALGGDGGGGAIHGFMFIERIGGAVEVVA